MIKPDPLKPGDTIGIAAPARKISPAELQPAVGFFQSRGFKVVNSANLFSSHNQYAGNDSERLTGLAGLLASDEVKAVLCARGGYGTLRIIDDIDFSEFIQKPKWVAGYSDVTVLHSHIHANFGIQTLHCTMPVSFDKATPESLSSMLLALTGGSPAYCTPAHPLNRPGSANGLICGGNLSILYALSGSRSDINTAGKILFIEDLEEYLYHIDRMMLQLKRSGKLEKLAALIVGGMTGMNDNLIPFGSTAEEIIRSSVDEYDYPVCFGFPAGHIENNCALIIGAHARLEGNEQGFEFRHI